MSNIRRLCDFVESSFLKPLLEKGDVTDISYNGQALFYDDRQRGHRRALTQPNQEEVGAFLRQIANLSEKQFSYMNPVLDVSFGRYRVNATFLSITRVYGEKSYSFALRLASEGSAVSGDNDFFPAGTKAILHSALAKGESIVIAGETGSGKTELQKYLLLQMPPLTKVIVIDNAGELELARGDGEVDITMWQVDSRFPDSSFHSLIKNALRNNPNYILIAEARGEEMHPALISAMSGHPIILTLHGRDLESIPHRMARLAQMESEKLVYEDLLSDIYHHFSLVVFLKKEMKEGKLARRIASIGRFNPKTKSLDCLYDEEKGNE